MSAAHAVVTSCAPVELRTSRTICVGTLGKGFLAVVWLHCVQHSDFDCVISKW